MSRAEKKFLDELSAELLAQKDISAGMYVREMMKAQAWLRRQFPPQELPDSILDTYPGGESEEAR
jgi:hypothetical protein